MKTIRVAAAVIRRDGRIFATQRGYGPWKGWWEFPGGKIETGETAQEALIRELREELDISVAVEDKITDIEYDYPDFHLSMACFFCRILSGDPVLREHEAARWVLPEEIFSLQWLPADQSVLKLLISS